MSDGILPLSLMFFGFLIWRRSRFLFELIKSNATLLVAFLTSWTMHELIRRMGGVGYFPILPLLIDYVSFFGANVVMIFLLRADSLLMQVSCSIFQLEVSRLYILGATPDLYDYIESGAYIYIFATAGSVFLAKIVMRRFVKIAALRSAGDSRSS